MKKVVNITLGNQVFTIEDDAYQLLENYISSVKQHFAESSDDEEIIDDIETGIAEKLNTDKEVVTLDQVQRVIKEMGTVKDFGQFDESLPKSSYASSPKKLYRNPDDKVIAGVSSGIAAYVGVDATYIRLGFIIATLFWGLSILVYIVLWVIMPEAKTRTQKLSMQGEPISLATLQFNSSTDLENVRSKGIGLLNRIFDLIGIVFAKVFSLVKKVFRLALVLFRYVGGAALMIGSVIGIAVISFILIVLSLEIVTPYFDPMTIELFRGFGGYVKTMLLGFGYLAFIIPLIFSLMLGISILKKKNFFSMLVVIGLGVMWIISVAGFGIVALKIMPVVEERVHELEARIEDTQREYSDLEEFTDLTLSGSYIVTIKPGEETSVIAQGTTQSLEELTVESKSGKLDIRRNYNNKICIFICPSRTVQLLITTPDVNDIELFGSTRGEITGFKVDDLHINMQGSSRIKVDIQADNLDLKASGSSRVILSGQSDRFNAKLEGSFRIQAYSFIVDDIVVNADGSSVIGVAPTKTLEAKLSGSNILRYVGENVDVDSTTSTYSDVLQIQREDIEEDMAEDFLGFEIEPIVPVSPQN